MSITKTGDISVEEALKSGRDVLIIAIAGALPQLLTLLEQTNFGEWNTIASIVLAILAPLINRWLNIIRV